MNSEMELEIGAGHGADNYVVRVIRAATGGEPSGSLNLDVEEVLSRRPELETAVLASAVPRRSVSVAGFEPAASSSRTQFMRSKRF